MGTPCRRAIASGSAPRSPSGSCWCCSPSARCAPWSRTFCKAVRWPRRPQQNATQYVNVVSPKQTDGSGNTLLPGTLRGYVESPIYARATGYLLHWYVDIGAHVKQGQLLADLDTPEIDQELAQAIAQRQQTRSSLGLAKSSLERWQQLRQRDAVSQQELDERQSTYTQDVANLAAAECQREAPAATRIVQAHRRAVRWRGHAAQRRRRRPDRRGQRHEPRAVRAGAVGSVACLRATAAGVCAERVGRQQVVVTQAELPGQAVPRHDHAHLRRDRRADPLAADRSDAAESRRQAAAWRICAGGRAGRPRMRDYLVPGNALLFRAEGPRARGRRCQRRSCICARS